ncbi:NADPH-dependent ferric siderophore reductase [Williamsia limnetica]|uniref:NADPH-dependent ferric siderophore reductase n=1 Tax=Williamsia limnetica TaxID=882452 RepID=A0A318RPR3_WILLI|nr:siderophore-interacting protein [Williamsia limnetica]PYE18168.1 NADPH-dependent ferric siderophore reductase [Williamsia limnetica]
MGFSFGRVVEKTDLNPRLIRIVFAVDDLVQLEVPDVADAAVGLYFPAPGERKAPAMENRDGVWSYYDIEPMPEGRNYSVRNLNRSTGVMTIDFVVHDHGTATLWAQRAEIGEEVAMSYARSWYRPEPTTEWQLLVADLAGLPALARIIEELPANARATAIVEVCEDGDLAYLPKRDDVELIAKVGSGNGFGESRLGDAVEEFVHTEGRGYCWFAAEAKASRVARKHLRKEYGWKADQCDIIGYWRFDGEAWSRKFEEVGAELFSVYSTALAEGKSEKIASEEFDDALERAGL